MQILIANSNIRSNLLIIFSFIDVLPNDGINKPHPNLFMGNSCDVGFWTKTSNGQWLGKWDDGGYCAISRVNQNIRYRNSGSTLFNWFQPNVNSEYYLWKVVTNLPENSDRFRGTPIVTNPHLSHHAYIEGVYSSGPFISLIKTINRGSSWYNWNNQQNSIFEGTHIVDMAIPYSNYNKLLLSSSTAPTSPGLINRLYYINTSNYNIQTITDDLVLAGDPLGEILKHNATSDIEINPTNEDEFWISIGSFNEDYKVLHTVNSGISFENVTHDLPNVPINALKYDNLNGRLYLGSDFGLFFLDDGDTIWNQDDNLEKMMFVDIEINRKTNEMFFSCWGRGFWKAKLPCPEYNSTPIEITSNTVWDTDNWLNQDIIVKENYELVISDCYINFMDENKIIVEKGAKLFLNGCTLTTACNSFWKGIEVEGVKGEHQFPENSPTYQGYVSLTNGAIIENAECAISTVGPGRGGVIKAYDSYFINNKVSIKYFPYQNYSPVTNSDRNNVGYFENCSFAVNDEYHGTTSDNFLYHAKLNRVDGVKFMACNFSNSQTSKVYNIGNNDNMAIFTLDAGVIISGKCNVGVPYGYSCPESDLDRTVFNGFYKAVNFTGAASSTNSIIKQCDFNNNLVGIEINNTDNVSIMHNLFEVGNCDIVGYNRPVSGIKVISSTGYRVEENTINFTQSIPLDYEDNAGISVQNCDLDNNQIYKNYIHGIKYAIVPAGINKTSNPYTGLQLLCNEFYDSQKRDIDVTVIDFLSTNPLDGIRTHQGAVEQSAANIFTVDHTDFQFHLANATQNPFTYYYNDDADPNLKPTKLTSFVDAIDEVIQPDINDPNNYIITPVVASSCPSNIDNDLYYPLPVSKEAELISSFNSSKIAYWNIYLSYLQEIDGGNTPAMLLQIQNTWSQEAWDMRNGLMEQAPFVSEEALREAAVTGVLPDAMLLEVCIANPDATRSGEFLEFLANDIPNPLPAYMIDMICANWDTRTVRTSFEVELAKHGAEMDFYQSVLLANEKLKDEKDSLAILSYYQQRDNLSDRYALADYYVNVRDISQSQSIITQIPIDFELNDEQLEENLDYSDFLNYMNSHLNRDSADFLFTTVEIDELELLANSSNGNASYKARNLLCFGYGMCEDYPIVPSDSLQPKSLNIVANSQDVINDYYYEITVSPNPAASYTVFEWDFLLLEGHIILQITDITGKPVDEKIIQTKQGQFLWDTRNIKNGVYLYSLLSKQKLLRSGKVIIEK